MLDSLMSLLALASIAVAAYGVGRPLVRVLTPGECDPLAIGAWSIATGLVGAGLLLIVLGLLGLLAKPLIGVLTLTAGFWGLGELSRAYLARRDGRLVDSSIRQLASAEPAWASPPRWISQGLLISAGIAAIGSLIVALAPPTAGDALCYHLELPKQYLKQQRLVYLPDNDNAAYPQLIEMWYLWALALDGGVGAQLVHWGLGILLALATAVLASPILGRSWALCGGCLILLVPGVNNQMTSPLNDVGVAAFTTLALAAWRGAAIDDENPRWFVMAGWLLGGALSIKHLALLFTAAIAAAAAWQVWRQPERRRRLLSGAAAMAIVATSVSGVWYLRAAWHYGNPVYPFLERQDGGAARRLLSDDKTPLDRQPLAFVAAAWQLTMHPERFGGRSHQLGALFLSVLPGLCFCRRLRGIGLLLWIALLYFIGWFLLRQNVRFLQPIAPLLGIAVVWVWIESRRLPRLAAAAVAGLSIAALASGAIVAAARASDYVAVAAGIEPREAYLQRREPSYAAAVHANSLRDSNVRILSQEHRAFYFDVPFTRENIFRRRTHYDQRVSTPGELRYCLQAQGFTHLLLAEALNESGIRYNRTLSQLASEGLASPDSELFSVLTEYQFTDRDGAVRRYRLIALR